MTSLAYTDAGQQQRITAGSTGFTNEMGGVGISSSGGSSTYYLLDPSGNVLGERIGSNHYYFLSDRLGSVVAMISGDGRTVSDRYGYDPYGNTSYHSGTVPNPWGYVGGYTDPTGLVHFGARYYDPSTARWVQSDPSQVVPTFVYSSDDPSNQVDPSGLTPCWQSENTHGWGWLVHVFHRWCHASFIQVVEIAADLAFAGAVVVAAYLIADFFLPGTAIGAIIAGLATAYGEWQLLRYSWDPAGEWLNFVYVKQGWWWMPEQYEWPVFVAFWAAPY